MPAKIRGLVSTAGSKRIIMYCHTRTGLRYALKITIRKPFLNDFLEDSLLTEINPLTHKLVGDFIFKWYKAETMFHSTNVQCIKREF